MNNRFVKVPLSMGGRVAKSTAGVLLFLISSAASLWQAVFLWQSDDSTWFLAHSAVLILSVFFATWSARYAYRGLKGYRFESVIKEGGFDFELIKRSSLTEQGISDIEKAHRIKEERKGAVVEGIGRFSRFVTGLLASLFLLPGLCVAGFQIYLYLKNGRWTSFSLENVIYLFSQEFVSWYTAPTEWLGAHGLLSSTLDVVPLSLALILVGVCLFMYRD